MKQTNGPAGIDSLAAQLRPEFPMLSRTIEGHPLAVGILSHTASPSDCNKNFALVRLDYYREWILAHVKQMQ